MDLQSTTTQPLRNVLRNDVICATSLESTEQFAKVQQQAVLLGGTFVKDLTSQVTHLITSRAGSTKHRAICERNTRASLADRVLVVKPSWLDACVQAALRISAENHLLPPFSGMEICCSGLDVEEKSHIQKIVSELGGKYNKVLGIKCTHLICNIASGKKYEHAINNMKHIFIIKPRWIDECSRHNVLIDETPFKLIQTNINKDGCISKGNTTSVVNATLPDTNTNSLPPFQHNQNGKRLRCNNNNNNNNNNDEGESLTGPALDALRVYLTESPIHDAEKHGPLRAKALRLIAHAGGTALSDAAAASANYIIALCVPVLSSTKPSIRQAIDSGIPIVPLRWLEDCVKHGFILSSTDYATPDWERGRSTASENVDRMSGDRIYGSSSGSQVVRNSDTFKGIRVSLGGLWLRDESACINVERQLISGRANILTHDSTGKSIMGVPTHIVCASDAQVRESKLLELAKLENKYVEAVTPFWVDSCEVLEELQNVRGCILFTPLRYSVPFKKMVERRICITISGFQYKHENDWNKRREVLSRLAELMGAKYCEKLRKKNTTHVIADERFCKSNKVKKAREWNIHVVTYEWLLTCAANGDVVPVYDYLLQGDLLNDDPVSESQQDVVSNENTPRKPRRASNGGADDQETISLFKRLNEGLGKSVTEKEKRERGGGDEEIGDDDDDDGDGDGAGVGNGAGTGNGDGDCDDDDGFVRSGRRSRSNSRDAIVMSENTWSMDASQSQMILHRDLTPPPTPITRRGMATRSTKRPRNND